MDCSLPGSSVHGISQARVLEWVVIALSSEMVCRVLKKLGIKPSYALTIPLLGKYAEETKIEKDTGIPLFSAALFTAVRKWKQPRCPSTDEWIK